MRLRYILHADMDAFYASVEQRDRPQLKGRPVVVGGAPEARGVVAAASYEARSYGVRSAMSMRAALQRCPEAVRVAPRFPRYREVSQKVMDIFRRLTTLVEPLSLDEAYLDITDVAAQGSDPEAVARDLKRQVREEVGLNVTVGVGTSKSIAKIASQLAKPDGLLVVKPGTERAFLAGLPVGMLWGVGPKTASSLQKDGIRTIGQLAAQEEEWFARRFGKRGTELRERALGQDRIPVVTHRETKSVSAETTLAHDSGSREELARELNSLAVSVSHSLKNHGLRGKTVVVKLRLSDFKTFTRQTTLASPTDDPATITRTAQRLLERELLPGRLFRLLGVKVSNFGQAGQLALFGLDLGKEE